MNCVKFVDRGSFFFKCLVRYSSVYLLLPKSGLFACRFLGSNLSSFFILYTFLYLCLSLFCSSLKLASIFGEGLKWKLKITREGKAAWEINWLNLWDMLLLGYWTAFNDTVAQGVRHLPWESRLVGSGLFVSTGYKQPRLVSGWCQDGNTSSRTITEVKHLELNQFSDG